MKKITGELRRDLNLAIDGTIIERVELKRAEAEVEVTLDFSGKAAAAKEGDDASWVLRFQSVKRFAASHRREYWQYQGDTEFEQYKPEELQREIEKLPSAEMRGWDYFNRGEEAFQQWRQYLTFDERLDEQTEVVNTIDLFAIRYAGNDEIIDLRIWFDDFTISDTRGNEISREDFTERFRGDGMQYPLMELDHGLVFAPGAPGGPRNAGDLINDEIKVRDKRVVARVSAVRRGKVIERYGCRLLRYEGKIKRGKNFPHGLRRVAKRHYLEDWERRSEQNPQQPEFEQFSLTLAGRDQRIFAIHLFKNDRVDLYVMADRSDRHVNVHYYEDLRTLEETGRFWPANKENIVGGAMAGQLLRQTRQNIESNPPRSVLVSGEPGVGKSTFVQLVARALMSDGWQIFEASGSDIIAGQQYIGQIEGKIKDVVTALSRSRKILWYIPDFDKLQHQGKYKGHPISVLDQLLPLMERREFCVIGECTAESMEKMFNRLPKLKTLLEVVRLEPMEKDDDVIALAMQWMDHEQPAVLWEKMDEQLLREVSLLASQYLAHKREPGRLLDLLKLCGMNAQTWSELRPIEFIDVVQTLSTQTGLPLEILDDRQRLDIKGLEEHFRRRIVGQDEAIKVIIERIAMIKAGLVDADKPSGVFLFVGPTGTGKTEIAKTLSAFLFGSEQRLIRLDMSEFQSWDSISRLTGEDNKLFTQIRKHPFSVVLLDEFEKAHPNIWDLFLQVFDDGRLTDERGETADFRHSIIILTSNLGAQQAVIPSIGFGREPLADTRSDEAFMNTLMETFRPEFVNRIDRIVRFNPLSRSTLRQILLNELERVLQRRGFRQRQWAVEWEDSALDFLLEKGYTRQLGARPLKRAVEEYLLGPLAMTIVKNQFPQGDQFLFVRSDGRRLKVDFVDPDATNGVLQESAPPQKEQVQGVAEELSIRQVLLDNTGTPAEKDALLHAFDRFMDLYEESNLVERKDELLRKTYDWQFWEAEDRRFILHEIELLDRIEAATDTTASLLERLEGDEKRLNFPPKLIRRTAQRVYLLDLAVRAYLAGEPQDAFLRIRLPKDRQIDRESQEFLKQLGAMYQGWARKRKMKQRALQEEPGQVTYAFAGFGAYSILKKEAGIHIWEAPDEDGKKNRLRAYVEVAPQEVAGEEENLSQMANRLFGAATPARRVVVRTYRAEPSPLVKDNPGKWRTGLLARVLEGDFDLFEGA